MIVAAPGYARFTQAVEMFKPLDRNKFNYRVKVGDIKFIEDASGKMYEIESIINTKDALLKPAEKHRLNTIIDWLYPDDIVSCLRLDKIVYHEAFLATAMTYQGWLRKNHKIARAVFDANDREICYAYLSILPLPESTIFEVLTGKRDEKDITPDEILTYDEPGEYTLLANSAVTHPDHPELLMKIIFSLIDYWSKEAPERRIKRIYAQTVSNEGRVLAKKLYMGPLYETGKDNPKRIDDAYVLDMDEPAASRIIQAFQERIKK